MKRFQNQQLQHQYEMDNQFRNRVEKSQYDYSALFKRSLEFKSEKFQQWESLLEKFETENDPIYFFYGFMQPPAGHFEKQFVLYFIKNFQPEPGRPFSFVYFNHKTPASESYFKFKSIFDLLPLRIIEKMKHFYLIKPYAYIKVFDLFGHGNRIFSQAYTPLQTCQQLLHRQNIRVQDFVSFVPEDISYQFPSVMKRRPSLLTYRINFEGQNLTEEERKEKHDFQNTIKALFTKEVYKLENYEIGQLGVPVILEYLVGYFKNKPQLLLQQGLFRKSVSIDEENETMQELSSRNFGYLEHINNPHLVANLIKKFFSNLKEPIIPFQIYDKLIHDQGVSNKKEFVKQFIRSLTSLNFLTLMFVIDFLKKDVVPVERETKMTAHNIAICFSPAFMRSEKPSFADIANATKAVNITQIMLTNFDDIFGSEKERMNLFQKSMIDRRKSFKKNLKEELQIEFDERASEQVRVASLIRGEAKSVISEEKVQPQPTQLNNEMKKNTFQESQPPILQPLHHIKSEQFTVHQQQHPHPRTTQSGFISIPKEEQPGEQVEEPIVRKKKNHEIAAHYLMKQNKVNTDNGTQQIKEKPCVQKSTIFQSQQEHSS